SLVGAEGQDRAARVELARIGRRLPVSRLQDPGGGRTARLGGHAYLALGHAGGSEVQDYRALLVTGRDGDRQRVRAQHAFYPAQRGDSRAAAEETRTDQSVPGYVLDPLAQPAAVVAVAHRYQAHAGVAGDLGRRAGAKLGREVSPSPAAIHHGGGAGPRGDDRSLSRPDLAIGDSVEVLDDADQAMRRVAELLD